MARLSRRITSSLYLWERKLLDRFRQLRRSKGTFIVLIYFTEAQVMLHVADRPERIANYETLDK